MNFNEFFRFLTRQIVPKMQRHQGLAVFARNRSKFEGWLKVELVDSLSRHFDDVQPEHNRVDVTFDSWVVELKTPNTNIRFPNVFNRARPIALNVKNIISDVSKLRRLRVPNRAIVFVAFPTRHNNPRWQKQLLKISRRGVELKYYEFSFAGDIPAVIYCGKV
jgi:hypothetical protein